MKPETVKRALLVEDDADLAKSLETFFRLNGWEVLRFASSKAALTSLARKRFDLVLSDWNLLGLDTGEPVIREAQRLGIPVLMMTGGKTPPEFANIAIRKGSNEFHPVLERVMESVK